jgi:hypothetical protein
MRMKTTRRLFILFLLANTITGCATGVWNLPSYDDLPADKVGVVFASLSVAEGWPAGARFEIGFRPVDTPNRVGRLYFLRAKSEPDFYDDQFGGAVRATRLPPGIYEIHSAGVLMGGGQLQYQIYNKNPFSYRFNVEAGKATYLGSFTAIPHSVARALGGLMRIPSGLTVIVDDQLPRDAKFLQKHGHTFSNENITYSILSKKDSAGSVFERTGQ